MVDDINRGGLGENLTDFYWQVVHELVKCTQNS
jgi:hypothetical protein